MTLFRVQHNKNYTVINNTICTDNRISWKAKGIWLYAFSRPDDWKFYLNDLIKQSTDGKDSVSAGLKELENAGYLRRIRYRDEKGQLGAAEWTFLETPSTETFEPKPDFPILGNPILGNPPLLNTDSLSITEKQQQMAPDGAAVVFECLKNLQIPESEKSWLATNQSEDNLIKAVAWATHPTTKITTTLERAIKWWLKTPNKPIIGPHPEEIKQQHCKDAHDIEQKIFSDTALFIAGTNHCEICPNSNVEPICFEYGTKDFHKEVKKVLDKYQFKAKS